ncbi:MAG: DUF4389 domain-containing protein [Alphaproteobacteria bacterium]|nr:DUF4389 domain-containing protein [Alphaproteobacteria bacterium]MBV9693823.1 DUF4389 domain-containing protein [Alphaproteobacteria bacterium]
MSDSSQGAAASQPLPVPTHQPFPVVRLAYAFVFALVAWMALWLVFVLGVAQFAILAVSGRVNDELKGFTLGLVQYLWELLAFIVFIRDERPFPFAPFPRHL